MSEENEAWGKPIKGGVTDLEQQLAEAQHALAMEKSRRSGEVCDMCNYIERANCVEQKDELMRQLAKKDTELAEKEAEIEQLDALLKLIVRIKE